MQIFLNRHKTHARFGATVFDTPYKDSAAVDILALGNTPCAAYAKIKQGMCVCVSADPPCLQGEGASPFPFALARSALYLTSLLSFPFFLFFFVSFLSFSFLLPAHSFGWCSLWTNECGLEKRGKRSFCGWPLPLDR